MDKNRWFFYVRDAMGQNTLLSIDSAKLEAIPIEISVYGTTLNEAKVLYFVVVSAESRADRTCTICTIRKLMPPNDTDELFMGQKYHCIQERNPIDV